MNAAKSSNVREKPLIVERDADGRDIVWVEPRTVKSGAGAEGAEMVPLRPRAGTLNYKFQAVKKHGQRARHAEVSKRYLIKGNQLSFVGPSASCLTGVVEVYDWCMRVMDASGECMQDDPLALVTHFLFQDDRV